MKRLVTCVSVLALLTACAVPAGRFDVTPAGPEAATGSSAKSGWAARTFAVASANPLATQAGYQIIKAGGSAVDAAIAVQMVLTLVEPQSSGIGGGAFLLHFDGKNVEAFDGRETAPGAVNESLFLGADGKPLAFFEAALGGRSVGAPGTVRMLEQAHQQHGRLPWGKLFDPALLLAENGFAVSPRLHSLLAAETHLKKDPVAAAYFYRADGAPHAVGSTLKNPALAEVLKQIAAKGSIAMHEGPVAQAIVDKVQKHTSNPGQLALSDLATYRPVKRSPICHDYQASLRDFRVCGFPPPSSGAIAIGQILGLLNQTGAALLPLENSLPSAAWLHLYTEASRLAFADRAQYLGDPDFVQAPAGSWLSLLDPAYLAQRAKLIGQAPDAKSMKTARPGEPAGVKISYAPMQPQAEHGTSHISIVDTFGNAVAMTTTIEDGFGARQMVNVKPSLAGGFLLNNQLTDFSFAPFDATGLAVANRVQAGKRPRSSMSPTLVFDKNTGALVMNGGSPGGAFIIHYTAKTLYGVLNWGLLPQQAIDLPNFASLNGPTLLEANAFPAATLAALRARGHEVREASMPSGLQAITRGQAHGNLLWFGGADPRREGTVMGD